MYSNYTQTIESIVQNLNLEMSARYHSCDYESIAERLVRDANHVLTLMQQHNIQPKYGDRIISIGCGQAEELIALIALYSDSEFSYTAVDTSSDYIFLCKTVFKAYENFATFLLADAAKMAFRKKHAKKYDLIILRHPHFLYEQNAQYSDFKTIVCKTIPELRKIPSALLFCTFYEEVELENFLEFIPHEITPSEPRDFLIEDKHEEYKFIDSTLEIDPNLGGKEVFTDRFSIGLQLKYQKK